MELRSLNHKFCEVKARLPRELAALESAVVKQVKDRLARGSVEVLMKRQTPTRPARCPRWTWGSRGSTRAPSARWPRGLGLDEPR